MELRLQFVSFLFTRSVRKPLVELVECVIRGCVPKKILVYGASLAGEFEDAQNYGWELNEKPNYNWQKLLENKTQEIVRLNGIYKRLLSNAGVKMYEGEGKVVGPHEIELTQIDGTKLNFSAKHILVATGGRAQRPNIPGKVHRRDDGHNYFLKGTKTTTKSDFCFVDFCTLMRSGGDLAVANMCPKTTTKSENFCSSCIWLAIDSN